MKKIFLFLPAVVTGFCAFSQLAVTPGAQLVLNGNLQVSLYNSDLIINGNLTPGNSKISFTGNGSNNIGGSQATTLFNLEINKIAGGNLVLQTSVNLNGQLNFLSGMVQLNGHNVNLGTTGLLNGEKEESRIMGDNGQVICMANLVAPNGINPGNLGLIISSSQNPGSTVISRGHQSQTNSAGNGSSILRYFDIAPTANTSLDATLRMSYFDGELNGLDENLLTAWNRPAGLNWVELGVDNRNTSLNFVEKNGIASLARFTLSSLNNALPVKFVSFTAACNANAVSLEWKTAIELNSQYYLVQRSSDGIQWRAVAKIAANGKSAVNSYSYKDNTAAGHDYYRVAEVDADGQVQLSNTVHADCNVNMAFSVWPNPAGEWMYVNMPSTRNSSAVLSLFDGKGALVRQRAAALAEGPNQIRINLQGIAPGLYYIRITTGAGESYAQKLIKK
jgi:hypothetical protein